MKIIIIKIPQDLHLPRKKGVALTKSKNISVIIVIVKENKEIVWNFLFINNL